HSTASTAHKCLSKPISSLCSTPAAVSRARSPRSRSTGRGGARSPAHAAAGGACFPSACRMAHCPGKRLPAAYNKFVRSNMNMRQLVFHVKEDDIEPCHYLKCPADGRYEKAEQSDVEIQRFLLWAHKAGLLKVWGSRRFALEPNAAHK